MEDKVKIWTAEEISDVYRDSDRQFSSFDKQFIEVKELKKIIDEILPTTLQPLGKQTVESRFVRKYCRIFNAVLKTRLGLDQEVKR